MTTRPYRSSLTVSFSSNKQATIVLNCLEFDEELQPTRIEKSFEVVDERLIVYVQKYAVCFFLAMHMHIDQPAYCIDASDYGDQPTFIRIKLFLNNFRKFFADDLKLLRVAMSSFFDMLIVCAKTLMEFDDSTRSIS